MTFRPTPTEVAKAVSTLLGTAPTTLSVPVTFSHLPDIQSFQSAKLYVSPWTKQTTRTSRIDFESHYIASAGLTKDVTGRDEDEIESLLLHMQELEDFLTTDANRALAITRGVQTAYVSFTVSELQLYDVDWLKQDLLVSVLNAHYIHGG